MIIFSIGMGRKCCMLFIETVKETDAFISHLAVNFLITVIDCFLIAIWLFQFKKTGIWLEEVLGNK